MLEMCELPSDVKLRKHGEGSRVWHMAHLENGEEYVDGEVMPREEILQELEYAWADDDVRIKADIKERLIEEEKTINQQSVMTRIRAIPAAK